VSGGRKSQEQLLPAACLNISSKASSGSAFIGTKLVDLFLSCLNMLLIYPAGRT
jgi:hypothetical protein